MRVLMGAFGTRGDVQPMVALAQALRARGHEVRMVVPPNSVQWVQLHGLPCVGVGLDYQYMASLVADGKVGLSVMSRLRQEVSVQWSAMEPLMAESDLVVGCSVFTVGGVLAERFGRPYSFVSFCPQLFPSSHHPSPSLRWQQLPPWVNRFSWWLNDRLWDYLLREELQRLRSRLRLRPIGHAWPELFGQHPLVTSEPNLARAPQDYPVPIHQVGALFLQETETLSPSVEAFLEAGPPPVYVGFGSMSDPDPLKTTARLLGSLRSAGVRALISRGWAGLNAENCPPEVLLIGAEPHGQLFPRCAAVVHHGGAGTTHAAARAGVPQVILPHVLDQYYWAERVEQARLGPPRVARHGRPEALAQALQRCANYALPARAFAARMRQDGAAQAASFLEACSK